MRARRYSSPACFLHELEEIEKTGGVRLKRAYDTPAREDGFRVLVDRLWPRGLKKEAARVDVWLRDLAPSTELRQWYEHEPKKWPEFRRRYRAELRAHATVLDDLRLRAAKEPVTLLFAGRDPSVSHARVLQELLTRQPRGAR
ncbi:MAG TPA: DUF488 family protein [Steroidobacteraceae bacterium]|jgi:uncharacterized protein YeaO (DUF488 family)|nr:DUF488 family protein [Steroidobacteraceae bacterium]